MWSFICFEITQTAGSPYVCCCSRLELQLMLHLKDRFWQMPQITFIRSITGSSYFPEDTINIVENIQGLQITKVCLLLKR